ncbi:STAS domain-containing protein [Chitinibacter bivalviorum]|uniref:STAS domain-containing protein n=1 Tax=Chitinibacter bivalviorum TaxID=2739434 RepID=A0A7H9BPN3_9NEIS|nr:STAS domain-containing protein [Chitinibacter bivalviorum]QLG89314.1 STAS domain-containing protein [Chitinibacter bivalviorum]
MPKLIVLEGEQTIYQARDTQQQLASALHEAKEIQLDLSQVQDADTAFMQILIWLQNEGRRLEKPVHFIQPSSCLRNIVAALGLQDVLPSDFGAQS